MNTEKQDKYYAVICSQSKRMILINEQLPIFWNRRTAKKKSLAYEGTEVVTINGELINYLKQ